ncbi:MAG: hypothetical protein GY870_13500 [archaeon]|nr:hypothetical protein [archaeon]
MKSRLEKVLDKMPNKKVDLKAQKVALGLIDEFSYGDVDSLNDEVSRLSYSVEEWFDEKFDQWYTIGREIYSVYFQNSEAFVTSADVARDEEVLQEIKTRSEELGVDVYDVYPQWDEHKRTLEYLSELEERFDQQKEEFRNESKSV